MSDYGLSTLVEMLAEAGWHAFPWGPELILIRTGADGRQRRECILATTRSVREFLAS